MQLRRTHASSPASPPASPPPRLPTRLPASPPAFPPPCLPTRLPSCLPTWLCVSVHCSPTCAVLDAVYCQCQCMRIMSHDSCVSARPPALPACLFIRPCPHHCLPACLHPCLPAPLPTNLSRNVCFFPSHTLRNPAQSCNVYIYMCRAAQSQCINACIFFCAGAAQ